MPEAAPVSPVEPGRAPPGRARWWSHRRVVVHDTSMLPTLRPGDRLRVDPRAYRSRPPAVGEIVVLRDPEEPARWLVKRVDAVGPSDPGAARGPLPVGTVFVVSDAPGPTRDSRRFGPVPVAGLLGRAYERYAPAERRGPL